ncbi:MAG: NUDIX domain-containing protein [Actinomycetota bacterium]|nr:NUDIX domain-containing protein [Actinomycetota bacterium]MDQ2958901.1 NUDIX domain-containing protein [Actinomycetota bacterium]
MPVKRSAGILLFRRAPEPEVLIGRLGGPFWQRKTAQNWSIPKGELQPDEAPLAAARREFTEELGLAVPDVPLLDLGTITQRGGKQVQVWAGEAELDLDRLVLGTFELEWPPKSGRLQQFEELAEVAWSDFELARHRLIAGQLEFLDRLTAQLAG